MRPSLCWRFTICASFAFAAMAQDYDRPRDGYELYPDGGRLRPLPGNPENL